MMDKLKQFGTSWYKHTNQYKVIFDMNACSPLPIMVAWEESFIWVEDRDFYRRTTCDVQLVTFTSIIIYLTYLGLAGRCDADWAASELLRPLLLREAVLEDVDLPARHDNNRYSSVGV